MLLRPKIDEHAYGNRKILNKLSVCVRECMCRTVQRYRFSVPCKVGIDESGGGGGDDVRALFCFFREE